MKARRLAVPLLLAVRALLFGGNTPSSLALISSANPSVYAHSVTFTATVTPSAAAGAVTFYDGVTVLGTASLSGGQAIFTTSSLPALANPIEAYYGGNTTYAASTSAVLAQTVNAVAGGEFQVAGRLTASSQVNSIVAGHFKSQSTVDLAAVGYGNTLNVMLGNSNGTFQKSVNYDLGSAGFNLATGDFNRDGNTDIVVATNDNGVSIFLGSGNGAFGPRAGYPVNQPLAAVAVADVNGDGKADLVVATQLGTVATLLGNGDGTFGTAIVTNNAATYPRALALGDFNRDGKVDVALADYSGNHVNVLLGNGDGSFLPPTANSAGSYPWSLTVADLNGDGKLDIASVSSNNTVSVLIGNGDGSFQAAMSYGTGGGSAAVAVGDWNGDGKADLIVANSNDNTISVLLGDGNGAFQNDGTYPTGGTPSSVGVGDFNGDGRADLAVANQTSADVTVLVNLPPAPDLAVSQFRFGNFVAGQNTGEQYQITVSNVGTQPISGTVTMTDTLPNGFSATYVAGDGWACGTSPVVCTTSAPLNANSSYPPITVVVNIAQNAASAAVNSVTVSGGGEANTANDTSTDFIAVFSPSQTAAAWTQLNSPAGLTASWTPILLTDGSVMVQQYCSSNWFRLVPDLFGSYANGTWTPTAPMPSGYAPLYFSSAVLADGRLVTTGGEYNSNCNTFAETTLGAIFDPKANTWAPLAPPTGWSRIGDSQNVILPGGQFLVGASYNDGCCQSASLNPATLTWTLLPGAGKADNNEEEGWTLLPDGSVLTVDTQTVPGAERYLPQSDTWVPAGATVLPLIDKNEIGPQVLRPDGTVFVAGATGHTGIYNIASNTWTAGPDFPLSNGKLLAASDVPAVLLPSGNVLVVPGPGNFFEFDGSTLTPVPYPSDGFCFGMLPLPNGQVFCSHNTVALYNPGGSPTPAWAPTISNAPASVQRGQTYTITGTQFNGLSQAVGYGDDYQGATNFPLVRIVNTASGHVFYCRTHDHSTMAVATGSTPVSTHFDVPSTVELGPSTLVVVVNGIASQPFSLTVAGASMVISTNGLLFGNQILSGTSAPQKVTLTNNGTVTVNITGITITGSNSAEFSQNGACVGALSAGSHCDIPVTFTPRAFGTRSATLTIQNDFSGSPAVSLSGTGTSGLALIQAIVNQALGKSQSGFDLNGDKVENVIDAQIAIVAALSGG